MSNKLFIICPFSCMEAFLQSNYGDKTFFLTAPAAVLSYKNFEYILEVKHFIIREKIQQIYIVNDTACRFINGIITQTKNIGFPSERVIEEIYIEHYFSDFKHQPLSLQQNKLAEHNVKNQVNELVNSAILGECMVELDIQIQGLITTKEHGLIKELQIQTNHYEIYEF